MQAAPGAEAGLHPAMRETPRPTGETLPAYGLREDAQPPGLVPRAAMRRRSD